MNNFKQQLAELVTRERLAAAALVFGGFLLLVIVFDQLVMPWYTKHGEALAVPSTLAQRYETAKESLEAIGLEAVKAGEKNDPNLPFGYVVEQSPRPNRMVKKGRRVYLTISVGEREITMPELRGLSENNAIQTLKSLGLRLGEVEYQYISTELPDVVIAQSIAAAELVTVSDVIDITVSLGAPAASVTVPSIVGKTIDVARRDLQKAGLVIGEVTYRVSEEFLPNTVLDQGIEAGTVVPFGEQVQLLVTVVSERELKR